MLFDYSSAPKGQKFIFFPSEQTLIGHIFFGKGMDDGKTIAALKEEVGKVKKKIFFLLLVFLCCYLFFSSLCVVETRRNRSATRRPSGKK